MDHDRTTGLMNLSVPPELSTQRAIVLKAEHSAMQSNVVDAVNSNEDEMSQCDDCINDDFSEIARCVICGGDGTVDGQDYYDWQEEEFYDPFAICPSCHGSGLAKDMTFC